MIWTDIALRVRTHWNTYSLNAHMGSHETCIDMKLRSVTREGRSLSHVVSGLGGNNEGTWLCDLSTRSEKPTSLKHSAKAHETQNFYEYHFAQKYKILS